MPTQELLSFQDELGNIATSKRGRIFAPTLLRCARDLREWQNSNPDFSRIEVGCNLVPVGNTLTTTDYQAGNRFELKIKYNNESIGDIHIHCVKQPHSEGDVFGFLCDEGKQIRGVIDYSDNVYFLVKPPSVRISQERFWNQELILLSTPGYIIATALMLDVIRKKYEKYTHITSLCDSLISDLMLSWINSQLWLSQTKSKLFVGRLNNDYLDRYIP